MGSIDLYIPRLLPHQKKIRREAKRFNVLAAGRRVGKTVMAKDLLIGVDDLENGALNGYPVCYCAPTYKMMNKVWREVKGMLGPIIKDKSENEKWLQLDTGVVVRDGVQAPDGQLQYGGRIDFWSLDNIDAVRGNSYKRVIVDEAPYVQNLQEAWEKSLRPLLSDYKGDFWALSSPSGMDNYFYELYKFGQDNDLKYKEWKSWSLPTSANPKIDREEIEQARATLPPDVFAQEYEGKFINSGGTSWLYTFKEDEHCVDSLPYFHTFPVYLSFDFNANPVSCVVFQRGGDKFLHILREFVGDMQLDEMCKMIKGEYRDNIMFVTGDASGNRHDVGFSGRNQTYYTIIQEYLGISKGQLHLNRKNLLHNDSRMLCNTMFNKEGLIKISREGCPKLIEDIRIAQLDEGSSVAGRLKKDRGRYKMDLFDAMRYHFQTYDLKKIAKYLHDGESQEV